MTNEEWKKISKMNNEEYRKYRGTDKPFERKEIAGNQLKGNNLYDAKGKLIAEGNNIYGHTADEREYGLIGQAKIDLTDEENQAWE